MLVVYIHAALYKISTGTPASRGASATAGLLVLRVVVVPDRQTDHARSLRILHSPRVALCAAMRAKKTKQTAGHQTVALRSPLWTTTIVENCP